MPGQPSRHQQPSLSRQRSLEEGRARRPTLSSLLLEPPLLRTAPARRHWFAPRVAGSQEDSTMARLQQVGEVLEGSLKFLSAQSALQGAFSKAGEDPAPPSGGPD